MTNNWRDKYDWVHPFQEGLAPVRLNGKWGCIDQTGTVVIPPKYDRVEPFHDGLALVERVGKYGFGELGLVDKNGNEYWDMTKDQAREQMKKR